MTLTIQEKLRMRAMATPNVPDILLDTEAADEIDRLADLEALSAALIDKLQAARAGDQQRLFHLEDKLNQIEQKLIEFTQAVNFGIMPPAMREMVDMIVRSTPNVSRAEAIDIVEKAAAKVFNEDFQAWLRSKPQDPSPKSS